MRSKIYASVIVLSSLLALSAKAGNIESQSDGTSIWQAGIDGVEIEWAPDGSFNRIYSKFAQPVALPDRQGITKAQIIAEEKAKAAIVRYLDQEVSTTRVVTEVQNDVNNSTRSRTDGKDEISKVSQRQMVENLSEITSSASTGRLRGVIVLERGYDEKEEVAWVKVGISKKTMANAAALKDTLDNPQPSTTPTDPQKASGQTQSNGFALPGSEVQRSNQKDW
jgi:hypothetical protein